MHLIFSLFFMLELSAKEVLVQKGLQHYKINITDDVLKYSGASVELSLKKKNCNEHIFKRIHAKLERLTTAPFSGDEHNAGTTLVIDKIKVFDRDDSERSRFFEDFDTFFKTAKMEELLSCKENK